MRKSDSPPLSARFRAFAKWWLDTLAYLIVVGALQYVAQGSVIRALHLLAVVSTFLLGVYLISNFTGIIATLMSPLTKWLPERLVDLAGLILSAVGGGYLMMVLYQSIEEIARRH